MSNQKTGTLREVMPQTAAWVDQLRDFLGKDWADQIILDGKKGKGTFRAVETGPDGVVRTFGSWKHGDKG